ncbi:MAG: sulfite exporter TauE/SafE family protein [Acidimicrobiia bacterium]|nr:sulfite exporter TauE/SafE family protein [Acidimicrobiia bacterium]
MEWWEALLLVLGGLAAGSINSIAGGGSLLTVPLLVLAGVPGNFANGSNRVGILTSNVAATAQFRALGVGSFKESLPIIAPVMAGSLTGAYFVQFLSDDSFERVFGLIMIPLLFLSLRRPRPQRDVTWPTGLFSVTFFFIGAYGGAFQAGFGLIVIIALSLAGMDLVRANSVKVMINVANALVALPTFIIQGRVDWIPALVLAAGFTAGGALGARITVKGGDAVVRRVMIVAVLALSGRLIGLY